MSCCDYCGIENHGKLIPGWLSLTEVPDNPFRVPLLGGYPLYHFCNLDELKAWAEDREQIIALTK